MSTNFSAIEFMEFGNSKRGERAGFFLTASISKREKFVNYRTGISHDITQIIIEKGLNWMRVGLNKYTGQICVVFCKDYEIGALPIGFESSRSSARIYNKELAFYWKKLLGITSEKFCERIETSADISRTDNYATFVIQTK